MVALNRYILSFLDIVNRLQDSQTVTDAGNTHLLEIVMQQGNQSFSNDLVFYAIFPLAPASFTF